jgi:hypothetical protein
MRCSNRLALRMIRGTSIKAAIPSGWNFLSALVPGMSLRSIPG